MRKTRVGYAYITTYRIAFILRRTAEWNYTISKAILRDTSESNDTRGPVLFHLGVAPLQVHVALGAMFLRPLPTHLIPFVDKETLVPVTSVKRKPSEAKGQRKRSRQGRVGEDADGDEGGDNVVQEDDAVEGDDAAQEDDSSGNMMETFVGDLDGDESLDEEPWVCTPDTLVADVSTLIVSNSDDHCIIRPNRVSNRIPPACLPSVTSRPASSSRLISGEWTWITRIRSMV